METKYNLHTEHQKRKVNKAKHSHNSEKPSTNRKRDDNDIYRSIPAKIKWPQTSEVQSQFREQAKSGYQYLNLICPKNVFIVISLIKEIQKNGVDFK